MASLYQTLLNFECVLCVGTSPSQCQGLKLVLKIWNLNLRLLVNHQMVPFSRTPGSGRHMSPNAMLNVQPTLDNVGTCAGEN